MQTLCYLAPEDAAIDRDELRAAVERLIRSGAPVPAQPARQVRVNVALPAGLYEQVERRAKEARVSVGRAVGAYAAAARAAEAPATTGHDALPQGMRPEQEQALAEILPALGKGRIVVAELGTGVGKSRVIGVAAGWLTAERHAGRRPPDPAGVTTGSIAAMRGASRAQLARVEAEAPPGEVVAIAAPTVSNVAHLVREFLLVRPPGQRAAALLGRQQFVSPSRLALLLEDTPCTEADEWLAAGMPPRSAAGLALAGIQPGIRGLTECLRHIAPEFPADAAALGRDESAADTEAYDAHRDAADTAEILFTTHAMICLDALGLTRAQDGRLPPLMALLVDEAHRLEEAQAAAISSGLHLSVLRAALADRARWPGTAAAVERARAATADLMAVLQDIGDGVQLSGPGASAKPGKLAAFRESATALVAAIKEAGHRKKAGGETPALPGVYHEAIRCLQDALKQQATIHVRFSPIRRFPSILAGPATVAPFLAARWATTSAVLLTSGTLLLPTAQGQSHASLSSSLALNNERIERTTPIHPRWLTHSPTVFVPAREHAEALMPPKAEQDSAMAVWAMAQAAAIERVAETAAGGTLVLCSGYERVTAIADALDALGDRLIVQDRKTSPLGVCETRFRTHPDRPVWIATGGAWTGLDLSDGDREAAEDLLLTDLVITATPFGMVHTSTHLSRVARGGFMHEKRAALMMLRQGLGRLIRRQGVPHRRLWFLDGRYANPASASVMSEVRALIQNFAHVRKLPPILF